MQRVRRTLTLVLFLFVLAAVLPADSTVRLKKRVLNPPNDREAYRVGPLLRRQAGRSHFLIQYESSPSPDQLQDLVGRGAKITSYVPDAAFVVSGLDDVSWDGLGLRFVGRLDQLDKLSGELSPDQTPNEDGGNFAVVEFHSDVDMDEARALVLERNLQIDERNNLLPYQLLVEGPLDDIERLAEWDEVAYIFPASPELANGEDARACIGAITQQGPVASYVTVGSGWPHTGAPGSPTVLNYVFGALTNKIPAGIVQSEIVRALAEWAKYGNLQFSSGSGAYDPRTLNIFFASGAHGDPYPFDGAGGVLAHTFYPSPPNSEPIAGDLHLDADESWRTGSTVDLFSVALHEAGHALGLAHTDKVSAVMYPFYKFNTGLTPDDIAGIQALYGAQQNVQTTPAAAPVQPTPSPSPGPAATALSLIISSPSANLTTSAAIVSLSGIATGGSGAIRITWSSDRGGSGAGSGLGNWSITSLPLLLGANHITVTATDGAGKTAASTIVITRGAPPPPDSTPPTIRILLPSAAMISTTGANISLSGIAADNVGVVAVQWTNAFGGGDAVGTTTWQIANIPLLVGTNKITVRAFDAAGNSGSQLIMVVRR